MPKELRPMPEAPQTPALRIAMERQADSRLLIEFLNWTRSYAFTDARGNWYVRVSTLDDPGELRIQPVDQEDLIARFYGITSDRIAADRRAIEDYTRDKLRWFDERDAAIKRGEIDGTVGLSGTALETIQPIVDAFKKKPN